MEVGVCERDNVDLLVGREGGKVLGGVDSDSNNNNNKRVAGIRVIDAKCFMIEQLNLVGVL